MVAVLANDDPETSAATPQIELASGRNALHPNRWTHVAMTWDGEELTLYVNGEKAGSVPYDCHPQTGLSYHGSTPLRVAGFGWDGNNGHLEYVGALSDLRIYGRALTEAEILWIYEKQ